MTIHRVTSNLERLPPLVVVGYARWWRLWRALALLIPAACVVAVIVALADYAKGAG